MSANDRGGRGGEERGRNPSQRERRLQQQADTRQAIGEQRQEFAAGIDQIDVDPQQDINVDRSGEQPTLSLTPEARRRRQKAIREATAEDIENDVGVDVDPSAVQLTDDGFELEDDTRRRVSRAQLDQLESELPTEQDVAFPTDSNAATNTILRIESVLETGNLNRISEIGKAVGGRGINTFDSPTAVLKDLEPKQAGELIPGVSESEARRAKQAAERRQQEIKQSSPTEVLNEIRSDSTFFAATTAFERGIRRGQSRIDAAAEAAEEQADEIRSEAAAEAGVPESAVDVGLDASQVGIQATVSDEFISEQRAEQRQQARASIASDIESSIADQSEQVSERDVDVSAADVEVQRRDGQFVGELDAGVADVVDVRGGSQPTQQRSEQIQYGSSPFTTDEPLDDQTSDVDIPAERPTVLQATTSEADLPSENINQSLVNQTTDSGGLLSENRSTSGGLIPSAIVTEQDTQALSETGQDIIDETQDADIDPATPAGALFTEASGVNLGESVTRGVGQFVGGALAAPQAVETATEFAQNAPLEQESVDTASAVAQSATRSTVNQAVTDPVAFGTGIGIGVATGTAASRGVSAVGGRVSSARQAVSMDFDEFRGTSRGQLDLTGRQDRQTVDIDDSDAGRPVPDDINEQRLISSDDPRRTAGEVGRQRAIDRDIDADTPDLEDRGQPSGQSAEVRSVDRPESVSTQDIDSVEASADRVLNPDTNDFTATERLEARNIGLDLVDPDFPRLSDRADVPGLSENPVRAGRATADTGPSAATVTDDVAAAATVTDAGEVASSARQPEGERVEERVPEEPTTTDDSPAGIVTGSPTLTGSQTPTTGQTLLETTQTDDLAAESQASAAAVGSAVGSQVDSRLLTTPLAEAAEAQNTRPAVGVGIGLGIDTATGTVSRSQSDVNTRTATDTATTTTGRAASDTAATTRRDTTAPGEINRFFATSVFGAPTTTTSPPTAFPTPTPPTSPGPRRAARSGESESRAVNDEEGGLISGDLGDEDFGVPQPGWFAETLQARAFGGLTQRGVASEQAQSASIGLGLPTERVAEAEGQEQEQLELVAGQLGLDIFEEES